MIYTDEGLPIVQINWPVVERRKLSLRLEEVSDYHEHLDIAMSDAKGNGPFTESVAKH